MFNHHNDKFMRYTTNRLLILALLSSTFLVSSNVFAGNGSVTITGTQGSNYVASNNAVGSSALLFLISFMISILLF